MIDLKEELQHYKPLNIERLEEEGRDLPDSIKNSVVLYNKALESISTGSEDIAIIELKKAVSLNPDFYEAMNLLGICYSYLNDHERAAEIFNRVVDAETNGVKALLYLNQISQDNSLSGTSMINKGRGTNIKAKPKKVKERKKLSLFNREKGIDDNIKIKMLIASFCAGVILTLLIVLPVVKSSSARTMANIKDEKDGLKNQIEQLDIRYETLGKENKDLKNELQTANSKADYYRFSIKLFEVQDLSSGKKYEEAADMLIMLKTFEFEGEEKDKFEKLFEDVMPLAANSAYEKGFVQYNNRKYEDAIKIFEKVRLYDENYSRLDAALYYMGRSYKELNDSRNAIAMFQQILDKFPNSYYYKYAGYRINELTQIP
jgi:tetratricopeptide (TPR) repeat protein